MPVVRVREGASTLIELNLTVPEESTQKLYPGSWSKKPEILCLSDERTDDMMLTYLIRNDETAVLTPSVDQDRQRVQWRPLAIQKCMPYSGRVFPRYGSVKGRLYDDDHSAAVKSSAKEILSDTFQRPSRVSRICQQHCKPALTVPSA